MVGHAQARWWYDTHSSSTDLKCEKEHINRATHLNIFQNNQLCGCFIRKTMHARSLKQNFSLKPSFNSYHPRYVACLAQGSFFPHGLLLRTHAATFRIECGKPSVRKRQSMAKVWNPFTEDDNMQCVCCKAELAYHKSTSPMILHLSRKHPVVSTSSASVADAS